MQVRTVEAAAAGRTRAARFVGLYPRTWRERYGDEPRAFDAIGYRETFAFLDGTLMREEAVIEDARRNALLAKRQRTWYRREPDVAWFEAADPATPQRARELVAAFLG